MPGGSCKLGASASSSGHCSVTSPSWHAQLSLDRQLRTKEAEATDMSKVKAWHSGEKRLNQRGRPCSGRCRRCKVAVPPLAVLLQLHSPTPPLRAPCHPPGESRARRTPWLDWQAAPQFFLGAAEQLARQLDLRTPPALATRMIRINGDHTAHAACSGRAGSVRRDAFEAKLGCQQLPSALARSQQSCRVAARGRALSGSST